VLKYEVAVHPVSGKIVWVYGGIPGSCSDITIARAKIIHQLLPTEKIWADKGYIGEVCFITPKKGLYDRLSPEDKAWNTWHSRHHFQHIERINQCLKVWEALKQQWRHSHGKHNLAFFVICRIVNVDLIQHPIWAQ
jgi:hypothetical protein